MNSTSAPSIDAAAGPHTALGQAFAGLAALAVAMGVGRFAFTPVLPMMLQDAGLSLDAGRWLASANYAGYLIGALSAMAWRVRPGTAIRAGLLTIAGTTLAMGAALPLAAWLALRLLAGFASAWVLIAVSAWCLGTLSAYRRPYLNSVVFAGVGCGIATAGLLCLAMTTLGAGSARTWLGLGLLSLATTAALWRFFAAPDAGPATSDVTPARSAASITFPTSAASATSATSATLATSATATKSLTPTTAATSIPSAAAPGLRWNAAAVKLVLCYGLFGFGYIIPATFLPIMAQHALRGAAGFGWSWPLFGAAAAGSTLLVQRLLRHMSERRLWAAGHWIMAAGMAVAAASDSLWAVLAAALCVGGSFMVVTLAALQEGKRLAGPAATPLIAAMTSAFALGQIIGPLTVHAAHAGPTDFSSGLLTAAALLCAATLLLRQPISHRNTTP